MNRGIHRLPLCPFPPVLWWSLALSGDVRLDGLEHYPKRTFRNRYTLLQSTGPLDITVPVERRGGRPRCQDETARIVVDSDRKAWQAVKTAYGRAPYFEEIGAELEALFLLGPDSLGAWNRQTIKWASTWLGIQVPADVTPEEYRMTAPTTVMPFGAASSDALGSGWPHVWKDRQSRIPYFKLGILDLILHLGPEASSQIKPIPPSGSPHRG